MFFYKKNTNRTTALCIFGQISKTKQMNKNYKLINTITGWAMFLIAAITYLLTIESSASLWDCGEFIACANGLEVGHPPGAPLFLMISRIFAVLAGSHKELIPIMINSMSALASAFTILFLFWTITHLARKCFGKGELSNISIMLIQFSGIIGSLVYTFSDTFWFSAVEGEVYAMSSLFTAAVFWAILKWEEVADEPQSNRWIILIGILMGMSIGVHLLNLLAIPAIVFVIYFRKYKPTRNGIIIAAIASISILAFAMYGIIQGSVKVASWFELFFINDMGLPYNAGMLIYLIVLLAVLVLSIIYSMKENKTVLNTIFLSIAAILTGIPFMSSSPLLALFLIIVVSTGIYFLAKYRIEMVNLAAMIITVFIIGYGSYAMIVIRSLANTPLDENNPENPFGLLSYLNREQYGDRPLFYGPYFNSPQDPEKPYSEGHKSYSAVNHKYVVTDQSIEYNYDSRFTTFFPRMYSTSGSHIEAYKEWGGIKGTDISFTDARGNTRVINKPTFGENLTFFITYQVGQMYFRYFMWNFVGRQNDSQGHGGITNGNWISGIKPLDAIFLGNQDKITNWEKNTPSRNAYYFLPLILGIVGLVFMAIYKKHDFWVVMLLFFFTGLAIVLYLNQTPYQPRERDYAYAGSFYAFAIWVGMGVLGLFTLLQKLKNEKIRLALVLAFSSISPIILAVENWDDHDRSGRYLAHDFAQNYLESCDKNALLFTSGDNDTFPLWYAQEVEGIRTDVRVVCLPLFNTDWYIDQVKRRAYGSAPLPISISRDKYLQGTRDYLEITDNVKESMPLNQVMDFILSEDPATKAEYGDNKFYNYFPGKHISLPINKKQVLAQEVVSEKDSALIEKEITFTLPGGYVLKNGLAILSLLSNNDWTRPLYYTSYDADETMGLKSYMRNDGFVSRFVPVKNNNPNTTQYVDTKVMYNNLMNKYKWRGLPEKNVYLDEFSVRTIRIAGVRQMYNQLAIALITENKKDSAEKVLDRCQQILPHSKIPFDYFALEAGQVYYLAGKMEKGNALLKTYAEDCLNELEYFTSVEQHFRQFNTDAEARSERILSMIVEAALKNKQQKFVDEITMKKKMLNLQ